MLTSVPVRVPCHFLGLPVEYELAITVDVQTIHFLTGSISVGYGFLSVLVLSVETKFLSAGVVAAFSVEESTPVLPSPVFLVIFPMKPCSAVCAVLFGFYLSTS